MLVSILIPCFNAEKWIGEAIQSALDQQYAEKEVLVVDDGSTDRSAEIIRGFGDAIRWVSGPNQGGNAARNQLLSMANGEWLQYLDADDYLLPEKISKQVTFLDSHPGLDVVYGPVTIDRWSTRGSARTLIAIPEPHDEWILLAGWWLPQTSAPLWRKSALLDVGGWKIDQRVCQEHELYLRLLKAGKRFAYCPHNGAVWRLWGAQSLSLRNAATVRAHRAVIEQDEEDFLQASDRLTPERRDAINAARFRMARVAWREGDRDGALQLIGAIERSDPTFAPMFEPLAYRMLWRSVGFRWTETLAGLRRGHGATLVDPA